jgi:hypothetical protein
MDRDPATGDAGAREGTGAARPARRERDPSPRPVPAPTTAPATGERDPEREGPVEIERLRKDDGRALIVYRRVGERIAGQK